MTQRAHDRTDQQGFSLIEALVALMILAIASVGLLRTVEAHIDATRGLELRAAAMLVAQNRLAELQIGDPAVRAAIVPMLGREWRVRVTRTDTADPSIARVHIAVYDARARDDAVLGSLDGFLDLSKTAA